MVSRETRRACARELLRSDRRTRMLLSSGRAARAPGACVRPGFLARSGTPARAPGCRTLLSSTSGARGCSFPTGFAGRSGSPARLWDGSAPAGPGVRALLSPNPWARKLLSSNRFCGPLPLPCPTPVREGCRCRTGWRDSCCRPTHGAGASHPGRARGALVHAGPMRDPLRSSRIRCAQRRRPIPRGASASRLTGDGADVPIPRAGRSRSPGTFHVKPCHAACAWFHVKHVTGQPLATARSISDR